MDAEIHFEARDCGDIASLVAFYDPDDDRLSVVRHADGQVTIRIGKGGHGPRKTLTPTAAKALANLLAPTEDKEAE